MERAKILIAVALAACGDGGSTTIDAAPPPLPEGWIELAAMPVAVGESAAAVLDGKVYVAGGFDTLASVQVYDIAEDTWRVGSAMPLGTDNAGAAATAGKVYVVGGEGAALLVHDVAGGSWSRGPELPSPRFSSAVELIGGELHLVGGWSFDRSNNVSVATHDVLDLAAGTYERRAAASVARNHAFSGVIDGKLYVTGGRAPGHEGADASNLTTTEVYDPGADSWRTLADLPTPRSGGASAVLGGQLYVLGGGLPGDEVNAVIERYDPASDRWERLPDMPAPVTGHRAIVAGDHIHVFGGFRTEDGKRVGAVGSRRALRYTPP